MNMSEEILKRLPYTEPFLFVDKIIRIDEDGCEGAYCFKETLPFYQGHFVGNPITPGVLLTECCAQIGLVCLGIFLISKNKDSVNEQMAVAMTSSEMEFLRPVFPNECVRVCSEKVYFRFSKLKCKVTMWNEKGEVVCKGNIAGMLKTHDHEK